MSQAFVKSRHFYMRSVVITQRVYCWLGHDCPVLQPHLGAAKSHAPPTRKHPRSRLTPQATVEQDNTSTEASRAEARRTRRETRDATDTTVDINPADVEMLTDSSGLQQANLPRQTAEQQQAKELLQRKSQLIMKLTTAGADLDNVIKDNKHELDEVLLKMLEKRAEAAYKSGCSG